ncbi:outer membrane beta-barrel protein [Hymenobacter norwichensis]|uniref:outer membrane beta-barrel protein n=1 Tax=Hymenobacter norwichensis TaxID=223903 RepID=UPI0003B37348|nr:outer membrane beta-barrel protein [Hymenobacter norwichensis]
MKLLLLPISVLALAVTAQAQQIQFAVKAAAGCSLPTGKYMPTYARAVSVSGSAGGFVLSQPTSYDHTFQAKSGFTAGLMARYSAAGRWSYGAELLLQYQPFAIEQRFSPEKAGYERYVSTGSGMVQNPNGSFVINGIGFVRDQNGNILLDANGRPRVANAISEADLPTVYRYSMASLELPLYARYKVAERWHLQVGVATSLLLDRQVRIETSYPEAQPNGQPKVATTRKKQDDPALRLINWRLVAETEYQLTSRLACTLSLRPALSGVFSASNWQKRATPYQVKQHAVSVAAVYFLQ